MFRFGFGRRVWLFFLASTVATVSILAQVTDNPTADSPAIVSPSHPKDSLGERVYEIQGKSQRNIPVVPGVFVLPVMLKKVPDVHIVKRLKKDQRTDFDVLGVIDWNGDVIDATFPDSANPDLVKSVLHAVAAAKFRPATLDGQPVAVLLEVAVHIQYHTFF
jgi:hypothetical protein